MTKQLEKTTWAIDKAHTDLSFSIAHFVIAKVKGSFKDFEGTVTSSTGDFSDATIDLTIKASSIDTNETNRDAHLKTPDFFDVSTYPDIRFQSTLVKNGEGDGNGKNLIVEGDLTVNGVKKPITLDASFEGEFEHPQYKTTIAVFNVATKIPRREFNIGSSYPAAALGEVVQFTGALELMKQS